MPMRGGAWIPRTFSRVRKDEAGFTLIELMSAMIVTSLGVVALITTLDSSRELISFSEAKETAVAMGQQELERIQSVAYGDLELKDEPSPCNAFPGVCDQFNPGWYLAGDPPLQYYRWDQRPWNNKCSDTGDPPGKCEQVVVDNVATDGDPVGAVQNLRDTIPINGPNGVRLRVEIQRFVTWVDDDCVTVDPPPIGPCTADAQDYKRVTVAVRVLKVSDAARTQLVKGAPGRPILLSTVVRPPRELP